MIPMFCAGFFSNWSSHVSCTELHTGLVRRLVASHLGSMRFRNFSPHKTSTNPGPCLTRMLATRKAASSTTITSVCHVQQSGTLFPHLMYPANLGLVDVWRIALQYNGVDASCLQPTTKMDIRGSTPAMASEPKIKRFNCFADVTKFHSATVYQPVNDTHLIYHLSTLRAQMSILPRNAENRPYLQLSRVGANIGGDVRNLSPAACVTGEFGSNSPQGVS